MSKTIIDEAAEAVKRAEQQREIVARFNCIYIPAQQCRVCKETVQGTNEEILAHQCATANKTAS